MTVKAGSLPVGLSLSTTGLVTGTLVNGPYSFTLRLADSLGASSNRTFSGAVENPVPVPPSLLAWWPGDNAVGDIIGGHHGSLKNGARFGMARVGRGFGLDGVNDFVQVTHTPALDLVGDFTIEGWITHTANSPEEPTIIGKRSGDNENVAYVFYLKPDGRPAFKSRLAGSWSEVAASAILPTDTWHHVALTLGEGEARFYANGLPLHTASFTATRPAVNAPATIGASVNDARPAGNPTGAFPGVIDELSLYNRALSATEISDLYFAGTGGKASYDLARDYSTLQNPAGAWSYRWLPLSASMSTYDPAAAGSTDPTDPTKPDHNLLGRNTTNTTGNDYWGGHSYVSFNSTDTFVVIPSGGTQFDWAPRQVGMGPGSEAFAVARWRAPQAGQYAVSGTFFGCDIRPTTVDVHIFHNATELTPADKRAVNSYRGDGVSHTHHINVAANDTVDFIVGVGIGGWNYDSSGLAATLVRITPSLGSWAASFGLTGPEALPDYDYDGDGQSNFAEWAFNSDPTVGGPAPQDGGLVNIGGQQWLYMTYRRYADREAGGVTYTPEKSDGSGNWTTSGIIDEVDPNAPVIPGSTACRCRVPISTPDAGIVLQFLRVVMHGLVEP